MAWGSELNLVEVADSSVVSVLSPFPFDATMFDPCTATTEDECLKEMEAQASKTQQEKDNEKKKSLLWSIAENKMLSESARVAALRLLHEIELIESGEAELLERIEQLEQKLLRAGGVLKPPRGRKRVEVRQQTI